MTTFHEHGVFVGMSMELVMGWECNISFIDEEWIKTTMEKIDLNGDGGISLEEFVGMNVK